MFFKKDKRWEKSIQDLSKEKISSDEFLKINKDKVLYCGTPFLETMDGKTITNVLATNKSNAHYFPAFSDAASIKKYYARLNVMGIFIKGTLKDALNSLDTVNIMKNWGLVIDPHSKNSVAFPPFTRIED